MLTARRARLLAAHGLHVAREARLSSRAESPVSGLDLVDGRRVKMRLYPTAARADDVWRMLQVAGTTLPRPILRLGRCLVVEYVEGTPLDRLRTGASATGTARLVRGVGRLLARLHRAPAPPVAPTTYVNTRWLVTRVARAFRARALLSEAEARALMRLALPTDTRTAISHGDPSPGNIVRTRAGRLRLIDEERLSLRPPAFDLARAVTSWPLTPTLERELLAGYAAAGGPVRAYLDNRTFWIATALATVGVFRLATGRGSLRRVADGLRRIARGYDGYDGRRNPRSR
ncbi:MAG: aminoglycoside phosphotransferase family protein [Acidobacteria bacterium]|nr:aminoglycoside phosphotransferase family protein [Acidobacteriota bacterium]